MASGFEEHEESVMVGVVGSLFLEPFGVKADVVAEKVSSEDVGLFFAVCWDGFASKGL